MLKVWPATPSAFAVVGLLALVAISIEPRLRSVAIVATLAGIVLAAALALLGVGSINSETVDLTQTGGRLSGTFGNANELGFAAALGIPLALAYISVPERRAHYAIAGSILILLLTLVLTFSRGAIIAAAAGTLVLALWMARGSRRRIATILAGAGVCAVAAVGLYAAFEEERRDVSFADAPPGLDQRDLSGWDSRALGPIPNGPSQLYDEGGAIAVRSTHQGQGASFRWGEAGAGNTYRLQFRAKAGDGGLRFHYALGDSGWVGIGSKAKGELERDWRRFSLVWRPRQRSPHANIYLWQTDGPSSFAVDDVRVIAEGPNRNLELIAVPDHLNGSLYDRLASEADREEERYFRSRLDAAVLAIDAFGDEPLRGIGWATFPSYAATHLDYGELAAHDQYLAIAAELGILGILLLGLLVGAVALGLSSIGPTRPEAAALGVLAAAAAGLVFVEALPVPQLSIPIAIAAAVVCARRTRISD